MNKQDKLNEYNLGELKNECCICKETRPGQRIVQDKTDSKWFHPVCLLEQMNDDDDFDRVGGKPY